MDTSPKLTKLLDFPNELLGLIVEYLDNDSDSLFWLSMTCRALHYVALSAFFEQNDVKEPASGWVVVYKAPRKTLPQALRIALFVEKLDQIHYYLNPWTDCCHGRSSRASWVGYTIALRRPSEVTLLSV